MTRAAAVWSRPLHTLLFCSGGVLEALEGTSCRRHRQRVAGGDEQQQEPVAGHQREIFADAADHRAEQVRTEVAGGRRRTFVAGAEEQSRAEDGTEGERAVE